MSDTTDLKARLRETQDDWPAALVKLEHEAADALDAKDRRIAELERELERVRTQRDENRREINKDKQRHTIGYLSAQLEDLGQECMRIGALAMEAAHEDDEVYEPDSDEQIPQHEWQRLLNVHKRRAEYAERERDEARARAQISPKGLRDPNENLMEELVEALDAKDARIAELERDSNHWRHTSFNDMGRACQQRERAQAAERERDEARASQGAGGSGGDC